MMFKDLSKLKELRKKMDITQSELAQKAGVSQSLIAKVESGRTMPSYENGRKILEALQEITDENHVDLRARVVQNDEIISLKPNDRVGEALDLMKEHAISQIPIIEGGKAIGCVTETSLLTDFESVDREERLSKVMERGLAMIDVDADLEVVKDLLKNYPCILTVKDGDISGLITKADLLKKL